MPSADMLRIVNHARQRLPGAVDNAILTEFFSVMKEFFIQTNSWRVSIDFTVNPSSLSYAQAPENYTFAVAPDEGTIVRLICVEDSDGRPVTASMPSPGTIVLPRLPSAAETYTAIVAITVRDPVTAEGYPECPEDVIILYSNELLDGLLGRMMSQNAKPYSNPTLAQAHLRKFRQGVISARVATKKLNTYAAQPWIFPQNFA